MDGFAIVVRQIAEAAAAASARRRAPSDRLPFGPRRPYLFEQYPNIAALLAPCGRNGLSSNPKRRTP